ncbi:MAG: hypothetical protein K5746_09695 [Clostridiales bacterium]|nr:hypothetical protein [Clostridiales bacterium]
MNPQKYRHICEVCGRTEVLTPEEAFEAGWDYPPRMGAFGILSPRTCPHCSMMDTVWAALVLRQEDPDALTDDQKMTLLRIVNEPGSIMPDGEDVEP